MRKVVVNEFMSLDGVAQAPGGAEEDPSGGFTHGGWHMQYMEDEGTMKWVLDSILEAGGKIAQVGSPTEIIADPANRFVADFIGVEKGKRALSIRKTDKGEMVVDSAGRAAGMLVGPRDVR